MSVIDLTARIQEKQAEDYKNEELEFLHELLNQGKVKEIVGVVQAADGKYFSIGVGETMRVDDFKKMLLNKIDKCEIY